MEKVSMTRDEQLSLLQYKLVEVLQQIDQIRPIQFLDWESKHVYNFLRLRESAEDDRIYIDISGRYDNLPAHGENPLRDGRNHLMFPPEECNQPLPTEEGEADKMLTGKELDVMGAEEIKAYIDGVDVSDIEVLFEPCTFACIKRVYAKYFGFSPVSTKSRERVIFDFKEAKWQKRRTNLLLNS